MKRNSKFWFFGIGLIIILAYGIWESFNQPSIADVRGDFEEVAFVRNEQNKGNIMRVYAVTVGDIQQADFDACADLFPTNDYGSVTKVYFFDKNQPYPTALSIDPPHYDGEKYQAISIVKRTGTSKE